MALQVEKNLSIFNFKLLPKAAVLALAMIGLLEVSAGLVMREVRLHCGNGDLVRLDRDFFCKNFQPVSRDDTVRNPEWKSPLYHSWKAMGKDGPFDAVVFGTSVADTGWVEMLKAKGLKILNTTGNPRFRGFLPEAVWNLLDNSAALHLRPGALLLYCTLTEREDLDFRIPPDSFKGTNRSLRKAGDSSKFESRFKNLWIYGLKKWQLRRQPEAQLIFLGKEPEFFQMSTLQGLRQNIHYTSEEQRALEDQFKVYRDEARTKGFRLALIVFPTKPQMYEWLLAPEYRGSGRRPHLEALQKACEKNRIPFLDLEKELSGLAHEYYFKKSRLLWFHADTHVNEWGAQATAKVVKKFVLSLRATEGPATKSSAGPSAKFGGSEAIP